MSARKLLSFSSLFVRARDLAEVCVAERGWAGAEEHVT